MKRSLLVFALVAVVGLVALADGVGVPEHLGLGGGGGDVAAPDVTSEPSSGRAGEAPASSEEETPNQAALQDELPAQPSPRDQDDVVTLVAHWGKIHVGYVLVYADRRVILYPDLHAVFPHPFDVQAEWNRDSLFERRLTADGLDRVRSGAVRPSVFLNEAMSSLPTDTWADSEFKPYEPSKYAVCPPSGNRRRLPAAVRALLRGKERTYNPHSPLDPGASGPVECFELSREEASTLGNLMDAVGLLPDGEWVEWGG